MTDSHNQPVSFSYKGIFYQLIVSTCSYSIPLRPNRQFQIQPFYSYANYACFNQVFRTNLRLGMKVAFQLLWSCELRTVAENEFFSHEEMRIFKEILRKLDSLNENLKCVSEVETKLNTICSLFYIPALLIILCYGKNWFELQYRTILFNKFSCIQSNQKLTNTKIAQDRKIAAMRFLMLLIAKEFCTMCVYMSPHTCSLYFSEKDIFHIEI